MINGWICPAKKLEPKQGILGGKRKGSLQMG